MCEFCENSTFLFTRIFLYQKIKLYPLCWFFYDKSCFLGRNAKIAYSFFLKDSKNIFGSAIKTHKILQKLRFFSLSQFYYHKIKCWFHKNSTLFLSQFYGEVFFHEKSIFPVKKMCGFSENSTFFFIRIVFFSKSKLVPSCWFSLKNCSFLPLPPPPNLNDFDWFLQAEFFYGIFGKTLNLVVPQWFWPSPPKIVTPPHPRKRLPLSSPKKNKAMLIFYEKNSFSSGNTNTVQFVANF
jgi:hypothetical protein